MKKLPKVVLVGRMNVGKSTLFNRLSESVKTMTLDYEGVTRDFISEEIAWKGKDFELVDTGGVSFAKTQDVILEAVRQKAISMLEAAEVVLFVLDGKAGLVNQDRDIAKLLFKAGKKVIAVINKADTKAVQEHMFEFDKLGFKNKVLISAQHGTGIADLLELIVDLLPEHTPIAETQEPRFRVVLLGKPNVGKSSLLNSLVDQERAIVSPIAGTTREPVSQKVTFYQEDILLTDTPGVRKQKSVHEPLESLMVKSSLRALERAEIILLLVDASEGTLADQELKLAFYAFQENYKALIILYNKQDLVTEHTDSQLGVSKDRYDFLLRKIEQLNISCKTGKNVGKIFPLIQKVWNRYSQQFNEHELTILLRGHLEKRPLYHKENLLVLYDVRQIAMAPTTLLLTVNVPDWFGESQLQFFENILREQYDLKSAPVKFVLKKRS